MLSSRCRTRHSFISRRHTLSPRKPARGRWGSLRSTRCWQHLGGSRSLRLYQLWPRLLRRSLVRAAHRHLDSHRSAGSLLHPGGGGRGRELCRLSSLLWRCHPVGSSLLDVSDRLGWRALLLLGRVPFLDHYTPAPEDIRRPAIEFQCLFCIWLCFEVQFDTDRSDVLKTKRVRESSQILVLRRFRVEAGHEHRGICTVCQR